MPEQLEHYLKLWDLSNPQVLAQTVTSHVYTVTYHDTTAVLKLLTDYGYEEQAGAVALRHWNGHGAIYVFESNEKAQLLEYASGESLDQTVYRGNDHEATEIIADVLIKLHTEPPEIPAGLYTLERWFRELFEQADSDESAGIDSVYRRGAKVAAELLAAPRDVRVLHGDIHHGNIRQSARGWLAYDPKGLVGERTYDLANTFCNPENAEALVENEGRILRTAAIFSEKLHIEQGRIIAFVFAYACLSAAWSAHDRGDPRGALRIAEIIEPHVPASF